MPSKKIQPDEGNKIKPPDQWKTGDEPMTGAQDSYVHTLAQEAGQEVEDNMTKAEAAKKIEELQENSRDSNRGAYPSRHRARALGNG